MKRLILFDVDGTLTESRQVITDNMRVVLDELSKKEDIDIGFVGGSDLVKQEEQLEDGINLLKYWFSENGLVAYKNGKLFHKNSFVEFIGEEKYQELVNFIMLELSKIKVPKKRGVFLELRDGLLNVSPVGRSSSYEERNEYGLFDTENKIREKLCLTLRERFKDYNINFVIAGQTSIDIFPKGWDKTYCLRHVEGKYEQIYFFGDKCSEGGNDFEIYSDDRTISFKVNSPKDTIRILKEKFLN